MTICARRRALLLVSVLSLEFLLCCKTPSAAPSETVIRAYQAVKAGRISDAEQYLAEETRTVADTTLGPQHRKHIWDAHLLDGSVVKMEIESEIIEDDTANVSIRMTLRDGSIVRVSEYLQLEGRHWRITLG